MVISAERSNNLVQDALLRGYTNVVHLRHYTIKIRNILDYGSINTAMISK